MDRMSRRDLLRYSSALGIGMAVSGGLGLANRTFAKSDTVKKRTARWPNHARFSVFY